MGCANAKAKETPKQASSSPSQQIRRHLTLGSIGDEDGEPSFGDTPVFEDDRSLLLHLSKQQVLDFLQQQPREGGGELQQQQPALMRKRSSLVGSRTDAGLNRVASFAAKTVDLGGDRMEANAGIGYACKKGQKPESPNQDSFFVLNVEGEFSLHGVFDGHGRYGHDVSNFVKENMPKLLLQQKCLQQDPPTAIGNAFEKMQRLIIQANESRQIDANRSGCTCSVIFYDQKLNMLHVGHVGDSRCVLGRVDKTAAEAHRCQAIDLTIDHKPDLPEERARIEKAGGRVVFDGGWNYRVYGKNNKGPGLNMSRAMGDLNGYFEAGISATPDILSHQVENMGSSTSLAAPEENFARATSPGSQRSEKADQAAGLDSCDSTYSKMSRMRSCSSDATTSSVATVSSYKITPNDKFVLICSDGVWEFMTSQEAVQAVGDYTPEDAMAAAEDLSKQSWDRWMRMLAGQVVDDITVIIFHLGYTQKKSRLERMGSPRSPRRGTLERTEEGEEYLASGGDVSNERTAIKPPSIQPADPSGAEAEAPQRKPSRDDSLDGVPAESAQNQRPVHGLQLAGASTPDHRMTS
eukprot:TRINITY_DN4369_c0_g3_i1.p1 TRINITY_DN4369_c0_g3~~TRINITY_DN4369_c0_g3_i1.p1  ORF type:complete len:578 (-),score=120.98 TRINITY_DN4369_c0_g3_i1:25-1758(-)